MSYLVFSVCASIMFCNVGVVRDSPRRLAYLTGQSLAIQALDVAVLASPHYGAGKTVSLSLGLGLSTKNLPWTACLLTVRVGTFTNRTHGMHHCKFSRRPASMH